jgi:hypothetical protein
MRIGAGAALLLSWQADAMLAPELRVAEGWLGWLQFALAFLLLFDRTVPVAGAGLIVLYAIGVFRFGPFHMLDYVVYAGIGYYLAVSGAGERKIRGTGLPALYASVGSRSAGWRWRRWCTRSGACTSWSRTRGSRSGSR